MNIVEDGTARPDAEVYITVAEADAYHTKRGTTIWLDQTEAEREQAIMRASDWMVQRYRQKWKGSRVSFVQGLDWPRQGVVIEEAGQFAYGTNVLPFNQVPKEVKNACAELSLRASIGALSEDTTPQVLQETVGPITTKFAEYASQVVTYTAVEGILAPLLKRGGSSVMMSLTRC